MYSTFIILNVLLFFATTLFAQQSLSSEEFNQKLLKSNVQKGHVMVFYVEQNTFALKTDQQKIIWIDPFLSRKNLDPAMFIHKEERINPEKTPGDYIFCTHSHLDHTHLETVEIMNKVNPKAVFIAPKESLPILVKANIPQERIKIIALNDEFSFPGFTAKAVYAQATGDANDVTHLGFLFKIGEIKVYDSGDTKIGLDTYVDKMQTIIEEKPDIALICINTGYKNLGPEDAVKLASLINCKLFIPTHYNCFVTNTLDPKSVYKFLPKDTKMKTEIMECNSILTY